jgi:hypothetical protein
MNRVVSESKTAKDRGPNDIAMAYQREDARRTVMLELKHQAPNADAQRQKAFATRRSRD